MHQKITFSGDLSPKGLFNRVKLFCFLIKMLATWSWLEKYFGC